MNVSVVGIVIIGHIITLRRLNTYRINLVQLSSSIKFVCKISRVYFILFLTSYGFLAIYQIISRRVLHKYLGPHTFGLLPIWYHTIVVMLSIINAAYFLKINRPSQRRLKDMARQIRQYLPMSSSNRVDVVGVPARSPRAVRIDVEPCSRR